MGGHSSRKRLPLGGLPDVSAPCLRVLFVGINPGLRSAALGHYYAGHANRLWRLLHDARLVPERLTRRDDARMVEWGFGLTNLALRPTRGVGDRWTSRRPWRRANGIPSQMVGEWRSHRS